MSQGIKAKRNMAKKKISVESVQWQSDVSKIKLTLNKKIEFFLI